MLIRKLETSYSLCCEIGDRKLVNQDRTLALQDKIGKHMVGLYLVADGCGGMMHGEKISQLIVDSFTKLWNKELKMLLNEKRANKQIVDSVTKWLEQINVSALSYGKKISNPVGSTVSLLLIVDSKYYIFNVGDSRIYLKRKGLVHRLTEDQSKIADMIRNGELTTEEAKSYPQNALTMCVGYFDKLQVFCTQGKLRREDVFLLCSDGLYKGLGEDNLRDAIPQNVEADSASVMRTLIPSGCANDNVSVILVQVRTARQ